MAARDTSPQKQKTDSSPFGQRAGPEQVGVNFAPLSSTLQRAKADPRQIRPADVSYLQRAMGNQAVARLLTPPPIVQAKLQVGPVGDQYEEEADRVARQVMRKPNPSQAQRKEEEGEGVALTSAGVQRMPALPKFTPPQLAPPKITPFVQRAAHGKGCSCKSCGSVQRHHNEDERVQRHHDEEKARVQRAAHGKGCKCQSCGSVQRHHDEEEGRLQRSTVAKDGSFEANSDVEGRVKNLSGRGNPLGDSLRSEMEGRFGGANFGNVRIHTGSEAHTLNRSMSANAFTHQNNIAFANGKFNPGSQHGKELLAHELTHTLQQTGGGVQRAASEGHNRGCGCGGCRPSAPKVNTLKVASGLQRSGMIQRHASWEHRLLGDVDPDQLSKLGQWKDPDPTSQDGEIDVAAKKLRKKDITHVLKQEIGRLKAWQQNPPQGATEKDAEKLMGVDKTWQVQLVSIPSLGDPKIPPLIVTYGEMNTLADFYGSVEELKMADPTKRSNVAQSVRNQSYEKLLSIYMGMTKRSEQDAKAKLGTTDLTFAGSFNITDAIAGEVAQMMTDKKGQLDKFSSYGSTLARNACHFAPESWHSWEDYHAKARKLAKDAYDLKEQVQDQPQEDNQERQLQVQGGNNQVMNSIFSSVSSGILGGINPFSSKAPPKQVGNNSNQPKSPKEEIEEKVNDALMTNGFGDHYLQDSYAAGHLLNKTQIMQWFIQWLDKNPDKLTYTSDTSWRQYQAMAYKQDGLVSRGQYNKANVGRRNVNGLDVSTARNPQAVENTQENKNANIGWEGRFEMLGLEMPRSIQANTPALKLMLWLQRNSGYMSSWTWKELKDKSVAPQEPKGWFKKLTTVKGAPPHNMAEQELKKGIEGLLEDHIIYMSSGNRYDYGKLLRGEMGEEQVFQDGTKFELRKEYVVSTIGGGDFTKAASDAEGGNMGRLNKMMKATVYKDYANFMKDGFIQKSTNALHDYFCENGLMIENAAGNDVHKIYGDNAMLNAESSKGVKESAETSRMSRNAIMEIAMNGAENNGKTTDKILERFPARVRLRTGGVVGLDEWQNDGELKDIAETKVFPTLNSAKDFGAGITSGKGLGAITKDENVHGGEAF